MRLFQGIAQTLQAVLDITTTVEVQVDTHGKARQAEQPPVTLLGNDHGNVVLERLAALGDVLVPGTLGLAVIPIVGRRHR